MSLFFFFFTFFLFLFFVFFLFVSLSVFLSPRSLSNITGQIQSPKHPRSSLGSALLEVAPPRALCLLPLERTFSTISRATSMPCLNRSSNSYAPLWRRRAELRACE
ncbi:unnamed protein product [Cuscuta europaea]|uniref:Uncharacterized protein n=1 Tax=Cuscuta europaea TaxID=41803 RepID=A0A9P0ZI09_CUSEU|nr:unnamed protein product [Cuscuta europaea]